MKTLILLSFLLLSTLGISQRNQFKNISEKDGRIGIGTNTPDQLLTVKGKIHTQEVLVDLNGAVAPDYVFEAYFEGASNLKPNYKMLTLAEVANYIQLHHHLPGVPSARQFDEDGFSLKAMNLLLLQKLEELTLYTIEQQEEIDALKAALKSDSEE